MRHGKKYLTPYIYRNMGVFYRALFSRKSIIEKGCVTFGRIIGLQNEKSDLRKEPPPINNDSRQPLKRTWQESAGKVVKLTFTEGYSDFSRNVVTA